MRSGRTTAIAAGETLDSLLHGKLSLIQKQDGYRVSVDAVLLADWVDCGPGDRLVDLGTGCGVIPLILHRTRAFESVLGVEIQHDLAEIARRNLRLNHAEDRVTILEADLRELPERYPGVLFDRVISNPPYRALQSGEINEVPEKAVARHEVSLVLEELLLIAERLLAAEGRLILIYPAERRGELDQTLRRVGLRPLLFRQVCPRPGSSPRLILLDAGRTGLLRELPPLIVHTEGGEYSPEMRQILGGRRQGESAV
jgi:tRNA1Val (adenine37-N6)-methyltransferase